MGKCIPKHEQKLCEYTAKWQTERLVDSTILQSTPQLIPTSVIKRDFEPVPIICLKMCPNVEVTVISTVYAFRSWQLRLHSVFVCFDDSHNKRFLRSPFSSDAAPRRWANLVQSFETAYRSYVQGSAFRLLTHRHIPEEELRRCEAVKLAGYPVVYN
jgi:hypothetical protein